MEEDHLSLCLEKGSSSGLLSDGLLSITGFGQDFLWIRTGICPRTEVLPHKDTSREEASAQCKINVFKCHSLVLLSLQGT